MLESPTTTTKTMDPNRKTLIMTVPRRLRALLFVQILVVSLVMSSFHRFHFQQTEQQQLRRSLETKAPPRQGLVHGNFTASEWDNILQYAKLCHSEEEQRDRFFPQVDVVITWVNGSDPERLETVAKHNSYRRKHTQLTPKQIKMRMADNGELRIALRSIYKFLPWVRKIFIVTPTPSISWLDPKDDRVVLVSDDDIFEHLEYLPTFNSMAVESQLHRIPGLSSKYIELNDDFLFGSPIWPHDFWTLEEDCQPNYIYRCFTNGKGGWTHITEKDNQGAFWSCYANVVGVFNRLIPGRNKTGPPIPFHLPQLVDRTVLEEVLEIPEIAAANDKVAKQRFRHWNESFNTKYAYTTYLQEWPQNMSVLMTQNGNTTVDPERVPKKYRTTVVGQHKDSVYWSVGYKDADTQAKEMRNQWKKGTKFWTLNDVRHAKDAVNSTELFRLDQAIQKFFDETLPAAPWELGDTILYHEDDQESHEPFAPPTNTSTA